jgi:hypothetical protein
MRRYRLEFIDEREEKVCVVEFMCNGALRAVPIAKQLCVDHQRDGLLYSDDELLTRLSCERPLTQENVMGPVLQSLAGGKHE